MTPSEQIERAVALTDRQIRSAAARALNRAATTVRAEVARAVKAELPELKIGIIKDRIQMDTASAREDLATMSAELTVSGKGVPLYEYAPRDRTIQTLRGPRMGVSVKVKGERKLVQEAFVAETKSGRVGIFVRTGDARLPIRELYSTTVADIIRNDDTFLAIKTVAEAEIESNLEKELAYQLSKASA